MKCDMKKRIIAAVAAIWLMMIPWLPVRAAAVFSVKDAQARKGSLMRAEVCVQSDIPLCAALFEFHYDTSKVEFRDVEPSADAEICFKADTDCVTVSYLNSVGTAAESLFTLVFKAKEEGEAALMCTVRDCADCEADWMEIQAVNVGTLSVTGSSSAGTAVSEKQEQGTAQPAQGKSKTEKKKVETTYFVQDEGVKNARQTAGADRKTVAGFVLCIAVAVMITAIIFFIRKIKGGKRAESSPQSAAAEEKDG